MQMLPVTWNSTILGIHNSHIVASKIDENADSYVQINDF